MTISELIVQLMHLARRYDGDPEVNIFSRELAGEYGEHLCSLHVGSDRVLEWVEVAEEK